MAISKGKLRFLKITFIFLAIFFTLFMLYQSRAPRFFPIKTVKVYGIHNVNQSEVQNLLLPLVRRGFFATNVDLIRERLLQAPWASDIFVRRAWPDEVEVTIIEKKAVARWNRLTLLSENGELFYPKKETYPANLPDLIGPPGKHILMLDQYIKINRLLVPLHARISYLELTPSLVWKLVLDNGVTLQVGHKDLLTHLDHFVKVYPKIIGNRAKDVDYIDLRYPNGVAVKWKLAL